MGGKDYFNSHSSLPLLSSRGRCLVTTCPVHAENPTERKEEVFTQTPQRQKSSTEEVVLKTTPRVWISKFYLYISCHISPHFVTFAFKFPLRLALLCQPVKMHDVLLYDWCRYNKKFIVTFNVTLSFHSGKVFLKLVFAHSAKEKLL